MIDLSIKPGLGAGPIRLGALREDARKLLAEHGYPLSAEDGTLDYFCENAIQLEFEDDRIRFIGISEHPEITCFYGSQDVFDIGAESLFALFAENESARPDVPPGETYFFRDQGLNLWEADEQYDRRGGYRRKVYAQVGVEEPRPGVTSDR